MLNELVHSVLLATLHVALDNIVDLVADQLDAELIQLCDHFSQIFLLVAEILSPPLFLSVLLPFTNSLKQPSFSHVVEEILHCLALIICLDLDELEPDCLVSLHFVCFLQPLP